MDKEFDPLKGALALQGIDRNPTAAAEHVPKIEWCNCTIKERVCTVYCTVPYTALPLLMMQESVNFSVVWLNTLPPKNGVLPTLRPQTITHNMPIMEEEAHHISTSDTPDPPLVEPGEDEEQLLDHIEGSINVLHPPPNNDHEPTPPSTPTENVSWAGIIRQSPPGMTLTPARGISRAITKADSNL
eukprot:11672064-Ditylum_brightwellii.AAC.1